MRKLWTPEEIAQLKELFPNTKTQKIADLLGRSYRSIVSAAAVNGVKKSIEFLKSTDSGIFIKGQIRDNGFRFTKDSIPYNKGKKMPDDVYEKAKKTMFKKGNVPHNTKFDGAISIREHKGVSYKCLRINKGKWIHLHVHIWEEAHGKVPKGFNIIFKDKNQMNCELDNLKMVSNQELMAMNTLHNYPQDIKDLIHIKAVLTRQINKVSKDE